MKNRTEKEKLLATKILALALICVNIWQIICLGSYFGLTQIRSNRIWHRIFITCVTSRWIFLKVVNEWRHLSHQRSKQKGKYCLFFFEFSLFWNANRLNCVSQQANGWDSMGLKLQVVVWVAAERGQVTLRWHDNPFCRLCIELCTAIRSLWTNMIQQ